MENHKFYANSSKELEVQLKNSFLEIKQLRRENQFLSSNFEEFRIAQEESRKQQQLISDLENKITLLQEENSKLQAEVAYLRGCAASKDSQVIQKSSYQQIEMELQDLQVYLKKFIQLQDSLIEQVPIKNLQQCWKEINQQFKDSFNTNQEIQNAQDELRLIELNFKELIHQRDTNLSPLQEMSKQQTIREQRVEIERIRKEVQMRQMDVKQFEQLLSELQNEFNYICKIETRKNNVQLEAEKQLIDYRRGISTTKNSNHHNDSQMFVDLIPQKGSMFQSENASVKRFQKPCLSDEYFTEEKSPIEKTIDLARKKLSRQLSQAEYKNI